MNRAQRRAAQFKRGARHHYSADIDAAQNAIRANTAYTEEQAATLGNMARMAWHRLTTGDGTEAEFDEVATVCNILVVRGESIAPEVLAVAVAAQDALCDMKRRYIRHGRFAPDCAALRDVPPMLDLHDDMLRLSTPKQMIDAVRVSLGRIRNGQVKAAT